MVRIKMFKGSAGVPTRFWGVVLATPNEVPKLEEEGYVKAYFPMKTFDRNWWERLKGGK